MPTKTPVRVAKRESIVQEELRSLLEEYGDDLLSAETFQGLLSAVLVER
jgi:hypothetical protein